MQFNAFFELGSTLRRPLAGTSSTDSAIKPFKVLSGKTVFICTEGFAFPAQSFSLKSAWAGL
jgi:hypothetical protein